MGSPRGGGGDGGILGVNSGSAGEEDHGSMGGGLLIQWGGIVGGLKIDQSGLG